MNYQPLLRSHRLQDLRRWKQSIEALELSDEDDPTAWCLRSRAHYFMRDDARVLECARVALTLDPECEWSYRLISSAFSRRGQHPEALDAADAAVRLDPSGYYAWLSLYYARTFAGRLDNISAIVDRLMELDPQNSNSHEAAGEVALREFRFDDAERHLRRALDLAPFNADLFNRLGEILTRRRRWAAAAVAFARALEIDPTIEAPRRNLIAAMTPRTAPVVVSVIGLHVGAICAVLMDVPVAIAEAVALTASVVIVARAFVRRRGLIKRLGVAAQHALREMRRSVRRSLLITVGTFLVVAMLVKVSIADTSETAGDTTIPLIPFTIVLGVLTAAKSRLEAGGKNRR